MVKGGGGTEGTEGRKSQGEFNLKHLCFLQNEKLTFTLAVFIFLARKQVNLRSLGILTAN